MLARLNPVIRVYINSHVLPPYPHSLRNKAAVNPRFPCNHLHSGLIFFPLRSRLSRLLLSNFAQSREDLYPDSTVFIPSNPKSLIASGRDRHVPPFRASVRLLMCADPLIASKLVPPPPEESSSHLQPSQG